jgi:hypothetical protein
VLVAKIADPVEIAEPLGIVDGTEPEPEAEEEPETYPWHYRGTGR